MGSEMCIRDRWEEVPQIVAELWAFTLRNDDQSALFSMGIYSLRCDLPLCCYLWNARSSRDALVTVRELEPRM